MVAVNGGKGPFIVKAFDCSSEKVLTTQIGLSSTKEVLPEMIYKSAIVYALKLAEINIKLKLSINA